MSRIKTIKDKITDAFTKSVLNLNEELANQVVGDNSSIQDDYIATIDVPFDYTIPSLGSIMGIFDGIAYQMYEIHPPSPDNYQKHHFLSILPLKVA